MLFSIRKNLGFKSQYYSCMFSYIFFLVVSVIISSFMYLTSVKTIEEEINEAHDNVLNQIRSLYDNSFQNIQNMSFNMFAIRYVDRLMFLDEVYTTTELSDMSTSIIKSIANLRSNMDSITNCMIVFTDKDICYDSTGKYSLQVAYDFFFSSFYSTKEAWLSDLEQTDTSGEFLVLTGH